MRKKKSSLLLQVAEILKVIHDSNSIHKGVIPKNIVVDLKTAKVYLLGLGIPKINDLIITYTKLVNADPTYLSPEMSKQGATVTNKSDSWQFGATSLETYSGKRIFHELNNDRNAILKRLMSLTDPKKVEEMEKKKEDICKIPSSVDEIDGAKDLITSCLNPDPENRLEMSDIISTLKDMV
jgi:serine/threonine protein kinase